MAASTCAATLIIAPKYGEGLDDNTKSQC
ncbi:uncharacterized protein METZ01_LOCUS339124, partial [marine metagenome]